MSQLAKQSLTEFRFVRQVIGENYTTIFFLHCRDVSRFQRKTLILQGQTLRLCAQENRCTYELADELPMAAQPIGGEEMDGSM